MLVAALAHEVADALVHGDASRSNQAWHACDDAMIGGRTRVRAGAEDRDELKHVVVIGSEHWRAGQKLQHRAASVRVKALHRHENRKHAMALAEGSRGFAERRDVAAIFRVHNGAGLVKINSAILAFFVTADGDSRYSFGTRGFHRPIETMDVLKHDAR